MISKKIIIWNSQDEQCRQWVSSLPPQAWNDIILIDYYENSKNSIAALDDLRSQKINYSGGILVTWVLQNPTRPEEMHIAQLYNPPDWDFVYQQSFLSLANQLIDYTSPLSHRVELMKNALCRNEAVSIEALSLLLVCSTLDQLESCFSRLVRQNVLTEKAAQEVREIAELYTIKLPGEKVLIER